MDAECGKAYPPSGTLEPKDVRPEDGTVDIAGNMRTELLEETGFDLNEARPGEKWWRSSMVRGSPSRSASTLR